MSPAKAAPIAAALKRRGWTLTHILNTHYHGDHVGGNLALKDQFPNVQIIGHGSQEGEKIPGIDQEVAEGDEVRCGATRLSRKLEVGGHTASHIAYFFPEVPMALTGDALFTMGCGRVFTGDFARMQASLGKLRNLPDETVVFCSHEYTAANVDFAVKVEPGNAALRARQAAVQRLRAAKLATEGNQSIPALGCAGGATGGRGPARRSRSVHSDSEVEGHWQPSSCGAHVSHAAGKKCAMLLCLGCDLAERFGQELVSLTELDVLVEKLDATKTGTVDYTLFVAALMPMDGMLRYAHRRGALSRCARTVPISLSSVPNASRADLLARPTSVSKQLGDFLAADRAFLRPLGQCFRCPVDPQRRSITSGAGGASGGGGPAEASKRSVSAVAKPSKTSRTFLASYAKKGQKMVVKLGHKTIDTLRWFVRKVGVLCWAFVKNPLIVIEWGEDLRDAVKHFLKWMYTGFKLFGADVRASYFLTKRVFKGYPLSVRERRLLVRMRGGRWSSGAHFKVDVTER
eukprot:s2219_g1.t1